MPESPDFATAPPLTPPLSPLGRRALWAAIPLLTLLLAVQVMLADRERWAANASTRPTLVALCGILRCTVPAWRELTAFTVQRREIQPHPTAEKALLVTASFRNDAAWPQAWPLVELALTDLDGQRIGLRRFTPAEYLGDAAPDGLMQPGQSAALALEILDPGNRAVAFEFDFYNN